MTSSNTGAAVCHRPSVSAGAALTHSEPQNEAKIVWPDLVERVRAGEPAAMEDLYRLFSGGIRFYLWRQLGAQDISDRLHDIFLIVTESIRAGELRDPECFMAYVRTIVRRQIAGQIHSRREQRRRQSELEFGPALHDRRPNPEHHAIARQYREIAQRIMGTLRAHEREVLVRFYFEEQDASRICREMKLTETQFRLLKSRAKARLGQLCRNRVRRPARTPVALAARS